MAIDGCGIESYSFSDAVTWDRTLIETLLDNRAPVATDDGYFSGVTAEPFVISAASLLTNDFGADGDSVILLAVDGGANGVAEIDATGNIIYTANQGFYGATTLTYTISDGRNGIAEGTVSLRICPVAEARDDTGFTVDDMPVQAYLQTGKRTVFSYLTKLLTEQLAPRFPRGLKGNKQPLRAGKIRGVWRWEWRLAIQALN